MITLPHDMILEVAGGCADSLEFRSLLNVAVTCHSVHEALKKKLEQRIIVRDMEAITDLAESCRLFAPDEKASPGIYQNVRWSYKYECGKSCFQNASRQLLFDCKIIVQLVGLLLRLERFCFQATYQRLRLSLRSLLHYRFALRGQGYDTQKVLESMIDRTWKPRHQLPLSIHLPVYVGHNAMNSMSFDRLVRTASNLTSTDNNEAREVSLHATTNLETMKWLFGQFRIALQEHPAGLQVRLDFRCDTQDSDAAALALMSEMRAFYRAQPVVWTFSTRLCSITQSY